MTRKDHIPVAMVVPLQAIRGRKWHKRKAPACDVALLDRPDVKAALAARLAMLPPIPWEVDPDTHAAFLLDGIRRVAAEVAP
eukprot:14618332-Alexandrium_andersonii.AAC.1